MNSGEAAGTSGTCHVNQSSNQATQEMGWPAGVRPRSPVAGSQSHSRGWRSQDPHSPCCHLQHQRCSPLSVLYVAFNLTLSDSSQAVNVRLVGVCRGHAGQVRSPGVEPCGWAMSSPSCGASQQGPVGKEWVGGLCSAGDPVHCPECFQGTS